MKKQRIIALTLAVLFTMISAFIFVPKAEAAASTPYKVNGQLQVKNGKIVNKNGKEFVIKGVSTHGIAWYPEYVNKNTFKTLRDDWGVNTIRLALYSSEYNGYCTGGNKTELKKLVENGVKYASDLGMYVIIDWHILSDGNPLQYKSQANSFFKYMAKKYAKQGNVMFEICNEPNGSGGSWTNIKKYANTIIKTIRSVNKKAIIIVGTPTWSQDVDIAAKSPIKGSNIAYAFHFYADTHRADMRNKLESALKKKLPVIVTEFGITDASGQSNPSQTEANKWMTLLNKYKVGRVCWNLSNKPEASALLKSSCNKISGFKSSDLSTEGKWLVKQYTGKAAKTTSSVKAVSKPNNQTTSQQPTASASKLPSKSATSASSIKLKATATRVNSWKSGGRNYTQYNVDLKNTSKTAAKNWKVTVKFSKSFKLEQSWCGTYKKSGQSLSVSPLEWNMKLSKNQSTDFGFIISYTGSIKISKITITAK